MVESQRACAPVPYGISRGLGRVRFYNLSVWLEEVSTEVRRLSLIRCVFFLVLRGLLEDAVFINWRLHSGVMIFSVIGDLCTDCQLQTTEDASPSRVVLIFCICLDYS